MKNVYHIISSHIDNTHQNIYDEINHRNLFYYVYYGICICNLMQKNIPLLMKETLEMLYVRQD